MRLAERSIDRVPALVLDVETTGLDVTYDRVVEVSAVLVASEQPPKVVFDSLVRPERVVAATAIHGITDDDVSEAPRFADLADALRALVVGRIVVGHNVGFDLRFLGMEFERLGRSLELPHVCTMRLPALYDRPARWPLWWACQRAGVPFDGQAHSARGDAVATAALWRMQRRRLEELGVTTFGDLAARGRRMRIDSPWLASLERPLAGPAGRVLDAAQVPMLPRPPGEAGAAAVSPRRRYLDAVVRAVARLSLDEGDVAAVAEARRRWRIDAETARSVHARILRGARRRYTEDGYLDPDEAANLDALEGCLARLDPPD